MSLDASANSQPDVLPYQTDFLFPDSADQSKEFAEPSALVSEALQIPTVKAGADSSATVLEGAVTVPENHPTGMGNVMHHLASGVGNEIVEHPGALAANAGIGFGLGYVTKVGLASQIWRKPTIAGLCVAGGLAAIDLISSAPGWMKSVNIASDTSGKTLEEVTAAEKHLQSLGGGALELAVGGVTGGLAFKPSIATATESMLSRSRAAIFGGAERSTAVAEGSVIGQPKDIVSVRLGKGDHETFAAENAEALAKWQAHSKDMPFGKLYSDSQGRATYAQHDDGFVEIFQYTDAGPTPSHVKLMEKDSLPFVAKFTEDGVRIPLANSKEALWKGTFDNGQWVKAADEKFADPRSALAYAEENPSSKPMSWDVNRNDEVVLVDDINARNFSLKSADGEALAGQVANVLDTNQSRIARLRDAGFRIDQESVAATKFIQKIEAQKMSPEYIAPGFTHYNQSSGFLYSNRVKTTFGNSEQYYKWEGGKLTELIGRHRGDLDPITVKVRNKEYFVTAADGTEVQWKGVMSPEGIFNKAPEESFATPFELGRALPQVRHAEAFENGKNYAAEIDKLRTKPWAREHFTSGQPRRLVYMNDGAGQNYFRYDQEGRMIGWTYKYGNEMAPFELKVTENGILIPHPEGGDVLWKGRFKNGVWWKHSSETTQQPLSLLNHLHTSYKPA